MKSLRSSKHIRIMEWLTQIWLASLLEWLKNLRNYSPKNVLVPREQLKKPFNSTMIQSGASKFMVSKQYMKMWGWSKFKTRFFNKESKLMDKSTAAKRMITAWLCGIKSMENEFAVSNALKLKFYFIVCQMNHKLHDLRAYFLNEKFLSLFYLLRVFFDSYILLSLLLMALVFLPLKSYGTHFLSLYSSLYSSRALQLITVRQRAIAFLTTYDNYDLMSKLL